MSENPSYRRKLIEVALPLETINAESSREKSIRHGHPSTLHLWWARRPLAACRAALFASIIDDPSSWPDLFPTVEKQDGERDRLFRIIEDLVVWENSDNTTLLERAKKEMARSISRGRGDTMPRAPAAIEKYLLQNAPLVVDPFCGGGSIPLEAQRLGLNVHASDLNPIAVLITKALIEIPGRLAGLPPVNLESRRQEQLERGRGGASGLAQDIAYYGKWIRDEAERRIGKLYPKVKITEETVVERPDLRAYLGRELTVIAWIWARTVASPNPGKRGVRIPLVRSFWLCKKKGNTAWVEAVVDKPKESYRFVVRTQGKPKIEGTVNRNGARCLLSDGPIGFDYIRSEGRQGRLGSRLMAIVAEAPKERVYLSPIDAHETLASSARAKEFPETSMPERALGFRVQQYGMTRHRDLFTARQLLALTTFSDLITAARAEVLADATDAGFGTGSISRTEEGGTGPLAYADAVATYLSFALSKATDYWSNLCSWHITGQKIRSTFTRQALPMVWDYAETCPFSSSTGNWMACVDWVWKVVQKLPARRTGTVEQLDATATIGAADSPLVCTDPPYYNNIGYADLSDFFYIWLRRALSDAYPSLFATLLTPKAKELIASPYRHDGDKDRAMGFFEEGLGRFLSHVCAVHSREYPFTVYYAFKQKETGSASPSGSQAISTGWETMLSAVMRSGLAINATWPLRTELTNRMLGIGTNALATSILLVCRPRHPGVPLATRRQFLTDLKKELPSALRKLQQASIAPVDLAQAAIGPGMAVFTRYSKVIEADGSQMSIRTALAIINQILDEVLAESEEDFDSDTRWAIAWFEQYGMQDGSFGIAETLSKAKNTSVDGLVQSGIVRAGGGNVALIPYRDFDGNWDPTMDRRLPVWEVTMRLVAALERSGEVGAADLMHRMGRGLAENARSLAYRLYHICDDKKWTQEGIAYNNLIVSWPEIAKLTQGQESLEDSHQTSLGDE